MNDEDKNKQELSTSNDYKKQLEQFQEKYQELLNSHNNLENRFKTYVDKETQSKVTEEQKYESIEDKRRKLQKEMEKLNNA